jgi:hypothetical protein
LCTYAPLSGACSPRLGAWGIGFMLVGPGAAAVEGAPVSTQDLDTWLERIDDPCLAEAARDAGVIVTRMVW